MKRAFVAVVGLVWLLGFVLTGPGFAQVDEDVNEARFVRLQDARVVSSGAVPVSVRHRPDAPPPEPAEEPERVEPADKIDPQVARWLRSRPGTERRTVIVVLRDDRRPPVFPQRHPDWPVDSPINAQRREQAQRLADAILLRRAQESAVFRGRLEEQLGGRVLEQFWLLNAMRVNLPLGAIPRLAALQAVISIEAESTGVAPPWGNPGDPDAPGVARALMGSDAYRVLGLADNPVALLDTGVWDAHPAFAVPSHLGLLRDCVIGWTNNCTTPFPAIWALNPVDDCDDHGTPAAGLLSGLGWISPDFAGVTEFTVDSFKVFPSTYPAGPLLGTCTPEADGSRTALIRAEQAAIVNLNRVVVANFEDPLGLNGSTSISADMVFWTGHVVIAANGNAGGPPPLGIGTVPSPAMAHTVLGIGALRIQTLDLYPPQGRGPTTDNRIKPDLQTYTEIQAPTTAWSGIPGSDIQIFGGTSAAAPLAGGVAALFDAWLQSSFGAPFSNPGQVYSMMLLSGPRIYPTFDNNNGVGAVVMPAGDGTIMVAKLHVVNGDTVSVQVPVDPTTLSKIDAAIWWPEFHLPFFPFPLNTHSNLDLRLINPDGVLAHQSVSGPSVFERSGAIWQPVVGEGPPPGAAAWTVEVEGISVPVASQTAYVAIWERQ